MSVSVSTCVCSVSSRRTAIKVSSTDCTEWLFTVDHWKADTTRPVSEWEQLTSTQQKRFCRRSFLTVRKWWPKISSSNWWPATSHMNLSLTLRPMIVATTTKNTGLISVTRWLVVWTFDTSAQRKLICYSTSAFSERENTLFLLDFMRFVTFARMIQLCLYCDWIVVNIQQYAQIAVVDPAGDERWIVQPYNPRFHYGNGP